MSEPIGIIGGSGMYSLLTDAETVPVETPYGPPSEAPARGVLGGREVVFLPRHGADHRFPPHLVPARANLWALRALGVRQLVTTCAVGGLVPEAPAGTVVIPDQVIDRTWGREHTYFDTLGPVVHVPFADPYCPRGRVAALAAAHAGPLPVVDGGTIVVMQGPRFSSRAESARNARDGGTIVNMTAMPETVLARELALCCTTLALVTDADAGVDGGEHVTQEAVFAAFARNVADLARVVESTVAALPDDDCDCRHLLDGLTLPIELP
ncbi:S-methyl-5'-thioadenosine phosphorylase [Antribacter sp. KLBMP9083]|uniref:Purine nucleoside phosphorylase n=1 Tax=Antribacter soli TaxID=2910976 RepID=A0AA41QBP6_9MICO|nr:S-methyl-5'-thioadenosine phosphorylase [Antribacter soli]MCF4120505.1 S-methyl-5'-thioadenosine phosphorylase [Antribacter soli]